jgi:hypothetical protein
MAEITASLCGTCTISYSDCDNINSDCECHGACFGSICCAFNDHKACYKGDSYWYSAAPCNVRGSLADDCTASEICNPVTGRCELNCMADNQAGCSDGNDCCSDYCVEGTCIADCTAYTTTPYKRCSYNSDTVYASFGIWHIG